ncbi:MOSC domain-containing protein [Demetria terragena]|uniref:MOSC domain-containing protein n=1 Tax=Demetria terragena TaxID=63959 RepID=UPI00036ECA42|nr:MOSC domain-containing protein [Demetria terragena]
MPVTRIGLSLLKGTRHRTLNRLDLDAAGAHGDRELCLIDVERDRILRTIEVPSLVPVEAFWDGDDLVVRMPGGEEVRAPLVSSAPPASADYWGRAASITRQASPHAQVLSAYLGRPVELARAARGDIIFRESISVVTSGALTRLAERVDLATEPLAERFRATFTLDAEDDPPVGSRLRLGEAVIEVTRPIDRCAVVDIAPTTGVRTSGILTALPLVDGAPTMGMAARVVTAGAVRTGDPGNVMSTP